MATILRGDKVAEALNLRISEEVLRLKARGIVPLLATLRVGERSDDVAYERGASKSAEAAGVEVRNLVLPGDVTQEVLRRKLESLNADPAVHGILLFTPLPKHLDEKALQEALCPKKDIDGVTALSRAAVFSGSAEGFAPCTPSACMEMLDFYGIDVAGKHAVVIGRSLVAGKPLAMMLLAKNATVTICHSHTENLPALVKGADVVIACVGHGNMFGEEYLCEGQIVIDVGINVAEDGSIVGDVDFAVAQNLVAAVTPVPGGIGAVTTEVLVKHIVEAASQVE
jgi:methylenetetrahydrofolate dehydrogenase (NADP+)/methenyltetrahydrofolate cyclohydrolase